MFSPLEEECRAFQAERTSEKPQSMHMLSVFEKPQGHLCPKAGCLKVKMIGEEDREVTGGQIMQDLLGQGKEFELCYWTYEKVLEDFLRVT